MQSRQSKSAAPEAASAARQSGEKPAADKPNLQTRLPVWSQAQGVQPVRGLFEPAAVAQERKADADVPTWSHLLSQPGEAAEQQADAQAARVLQGSRSAIARTSPRGDHLPAGTPAAVAKQAGRGRSIAPIDAAHFGPRFGTGLSHVRIHDDEQSAALADAADAQAFTVGSHLFFNRGKYQPDTSAGRSLLAHELAHVVQEHAGPARLWRKPKSEVILGEPEINPPSATAQAGEEEWLHVEVFATGMDAAAKILADEKLTFPAAPNRQNVFVGLHPKFLKVYDQNGTSQARIPLKEIKGLKFNPGVYIQLSQGLVALTRSSKDPTKYSFEGTDRSVIGQRPLTDKEKKTMEENAKKAGGTPAPTPSSVLNLGAAVTEPDKYRSMLTTPPNALVIFFAPAYDLSAASGKEGGEQKQLYSSPIEGRGDGQPANAPPWPVSVEGPKLVPVNSDPTFSAKVDWTANGNYTVAAQAISQIGETIHYRWERFNITQYAKQQLVKDPAATKDDPADKPEKSLEERIDDFKKAKAGTGTDVTGMGGAKREFKREFEDWWKDTKRAQKGAVSPGGDTIGEKLSNAAANRLSLELAPVALLTTAVGATMRLIADLFAGPRQQQEIPLETKGIFLVRVITTPAINEDREGKPIIRPPSVAAKITEVTPMDQAVRESLDEPGAQLAELQSQIDLAEQAGNTSKAEYLRSLLAEAKERFEGSPLSLLTKKRNDKQRELEKFRKDYSTLSDYSRAREVAMLNDQIALYQRHEQKRTEGTTGLAPLKRVNATLISEVTGEQYPLLLSAGPMAMVGSRYQWMISDVTNREGDAFTGLGDTPSAAFESALTKFGGKAAYGRGRIGARTAGLGLEENAKPEFLVESLATDWALAEKRIDDLVMTLAALGLFVASAGTASALIGAAVAAARLIERWQAGKLYLDAQTVSDLLGVLGGIGAAGQLGAGLRIQKFEKAFAITQEGRVTEVQIARAAEALKGAQELAKIVEIANEAINYGGLIWGDVSFIDQIMSISAQERSGAITHAAARRQRASAISSAVQNNGFFIAGNVQKAKHAASSEKKAAPTEKTPIEKTPTETTSPKETTPSKEPIPTEPAPKETLPADDVLPEEGNKPAQKLGEPVPLGERRATLAEMKAALPSDLHEMVVVDDTLHGDDVRADYKVDPDTGLITEIKLRCSPDARPATIALHEQTVRTMQKYQGFSGRVRQAISWVADLIGVDTLKPENKILFEAQLEIGKLPDLIEAQMNRMRDMEPNARDMAEAELAHLKNQLEEHLSTLDIGDIGEGAGFVAAKGLSKAKQKQYADLLAQLRTLEPGTAEHKKVRREMYELVGGNKPYGTWEKIYDSNVERANKANAAVEAEHERLGWGKTEQTVKTGKDEVRRLDIANVKGKKGIEIKEYEGGTIYAGADIVSEVQRDAKLVKRGWSIKWILIDTEPSGPLLKLLLNAGIIVEIRTRKGASTEFVSRSLPKNSKAGAQ